MLELIMPDKRGLRKGDCCVSISGKFKRILLFQESHKLMKIEYGKDFDYVQFWADPAQPDRFWIKPVAKAAVGATRIIMNPNNGTRTISVSYLLKSLGWECGAECPLSDILGLGE